MAEAASYRGERREVGVADGVSKWIDLTGESTKSWDEAVRLAVREASKTIQNITDVEVEGMRGVIRDGGMALYQVRCRVSFRIDDRLRAH